MCLYQLKNEKAKKGNEQNEDCTMSLQCGCTRCLIATVWWFYLPPVLLMLSCSQ